MTSEAPQEYLTSVPFIESTVEELLGKHFSEARRLYYGRNYVEALDYLVSIYRQLEGHLEDVPAEALIDLKYHLFKAWHMSDKDKSRDETLVLPMKLWDLENDLKNNGTPIHKFAVEIVDDFGSSDTHRQLLRILDMVYQTHLVEYFKSMMPRRKSTR